MVPDRTTPRAWDRSHAFALGLAPALIVLTIITLGPAIYLVVTSLTPLNLTNPTTAFDFSHPFGNYEDALTDSRFLNSVWVQVKLSGATVVLQLAAGSPWRSCSMRIRACSRRFARRS